MLLRAVVGRRRRRLSEPAGAADHSVPAGRQQRRGRPLVAQQLSVKLGQQVYRRQSRRRRRHHRHRGLRERGAGRLHALRHIDRACGQPGAVHAQIRSDQILHADFHLRHRAERAGGQSDIADQIGERAARARQGETGRAQLRLGRRRQLPASRRRTVQADGRRQHRARAVQRRRAGDAGRDQPGM